MTIFDYATVMATGVVTTLELTVASAALACVVSFLAGLARISRIRLIRWPVSVFVEIFRGTSCYIQLFWLFFALPLFGIYLNAFFVGVIAIGLNIGSFGSDVVRASILSVANDQIEAGIALNLSRWQRMRWVVLPQALITMLPPMGNLIIELVKTTPLVSLITIADITFVVQLFRQQTGETFEAYGSLMVVYFIISTVVALIFSSLESRFSAGIDNTATS